MQFYVFLSTGFKGETKETMEWHRQFTEVYVREELESLRDDEDEVIIVDNFDFVSTKEHSRQAKLETYGSALSKMAFCDIFVLLKEYDGSIKPGCMLELNAWLAAGGQQPIIRNKISYEDHQ
jgi:hypothetical protein